MKFIHLSDLHIGKNLHHHNLREDQQYILQQVIEKVKELKPDAVLIAGDIYDKSMPSAEAVNLFDDFLTALTLIEPAVTVIIISGNHDSGERLDFASGILKHHQVYLSGKVPADSEEHLRRVTLEDDHGPVDFYLLPFIKPAHVRHLWEDSENKSYDDSVRAMIEREEIDFDSRRNVLLSHQFYISGSSRPETTDSELISVGGIDQVDTGCIAGFDYAALGHLHRPQNIGRETIRYCGTLLKYSVSEADHQKSLTVVELKEKGSPAVITAIPLEPLRDVKRVKGTLQEVLDQAQEADQDDFVSIVLTDENELFMPKEQLSNKYHRILEVRLENKKMSESLSGTEREVLVSDPLTVFTEFYEEIKGTGLSEEEQAVLIGILDAVKGEEQR